MYVSDDLWDRESDYRKTAIRNNQQTPAMDSIFVGRPKSAKQFGNEKNLDYIFNSQNLKESPELWK